jgi:ribosomal protein L24E
MFTEYPTMTLSLIVDFIMTIIVLAFILYVINAKPENRAIATDDDDDTNEQENEFISEWISVIKERIEYENKLSKEEYEKLGDNKIIWCDNIVDDNYNCDIIRERFKYEISLNIEKQLNLGMGDYIRWDILSNTENMNVIELLEERLEYENRLTEEEYIRLNKYSERCVSLLSLICNNNATKLIKNKNIIELLTNNPHKIDWNSCYEDSCITDNFIVLLNKLFEKNPDEICWITISSYPFNENPTIIMLLKKRLRYENNLSKEEYDKLKYKINRNALYIVQDFVFDGLCNDKHNQIDTNMIKWYNVGNDIGVNITNISKTKYIELERVLINFIINEYEEELDALSYIHDNYSFYKDNKDHKDYLKNIGRIPMSFNLINYRNILIKYEKKLSKEKYKNIEYILDIFRNTHKFNKLKERIEYEKGLSEEEYVNLSNKISWYSLSKNPNIIELLKENPDKIDWVWLSENPNPKAFELLKQNPDKIKWRYLEKNKQCLELMKSYREKIDWGELSRNV